jgi:serine/threonine-protein kinase RsbW
MSTRGLTDVSCSSRAGGRPVDGELDPHEEPAGVLVAELLALDDVAAAVGEQPGDGGHDPRPVRAGQGEHELGHRRALRERFRAQGTSGRRPAGVGKAGVPPIPVQGGQVSAPHAGHPDLVEINVALSLPRDAASVSVGRQVLTGCLEVLGVTPATRADIALALGEACANVIQHAGPGDEYAVRARAVNGRCVIEVINAGSDAGSIDLQAAPVPLTAERGRGLQIMDAVVDRLSLTGDDDKTMTVHFEKALQWLPGAPGQVLLAESPGGADPA